MNSLLNGISPLPHLGIIRVEGEDAAQFLHSQLTQDFALLGLGQARLTAFCSAQGRMQASFIGFKRSANEILLICSRDLLERTLKRLSMFVLRAKAKLNDATDSFVLQGLAGEAVSAVGTAQVPWVCESLGEARLIHLYPTDGTARALWLAPADTPAPQGIALPHATWLWGEVMSGVATLSAPVFEAFVPQMLNYESLDGINFKKGCYPGQEVVARSQFRGAIKRRAYLAHTTVPVTAGQEVFDTADTSQPCGLVAQAAATPDAAGGGFDAIVVVQTAHAQARLQASDTALELRPMPYALREDI